MKGMNLFKKGAVFASASVVIQQPSAIGRAAALIDLKYFIGQKVDQKRHKALWEEVKHYAPVAAIKEMGYFDTNMGKSTQDYLLGEEYDSLGAKAKAMFTDEGYRDEVLSKAPALADEITWCAIWDAVKRETMAKNPGMKANSEAFLKKAGERFTEVIVKTQVYDSVLSRSANMRSKDTGMKMATAFMAEPTTAINMIEDALIKGIRGDAEGRKYCRRVIGSVLAAQVFNAALVSLVYAARDDDEEKSLKEKYVSSFVSSLIDGINPATYIPLLKDFSSIVKGFAVERSDMSAVKDLWEAWKQLENEDVSAWRKVEDFAGSVCKIFGLPVKNIMRDVRAIYQVCDALIHGEKTTKAGMKYAVRAELPEWLGGETASNTMQLYEARMAGDAEHIARVEARYEDEDSANAAVRAAIKERFMAGELDTADTLKHMVQYSGMDATEAHWLLDAWEYRKANGSDEGYSKYGKLYDAVESGENLKAVVQTYMDNGVKAETLTGQITEQFKEKYVQLSEAERKSMKKSIEEAYVLCGMDQEKAAEKIEGWDFEAEYGFAYADRKSAYLEGQVSRDTLVDILVANGKTEEEAQTQVELYDWAAAGVEDVSQDAVSDYYEFCEPVGIPRDVFMEYRRFDNATENDVDENGNSIAYSAVKKIMAYIDNLNLSSEQKTALAQCAGWKDSTIKKYKLWD